MLTNQISSVRNSLGLRFDFLENGSVRCIEAPPLRISLRVGTLLSGSATNLFLRKLGDNIEYHPLLGPESGSKFAVGDNSFIAHGSWNGIEYKCSLQLSDKSLSWSWRVDIRNISGENERLDLVYLQDAGLKPSNPGLVNEYYVSQYLERRILEDKLYGSVLSVRQNMKESFGNPWLLLACKNRAVSALTDGMQFYGNDFRQSRIPKALLSEKLSGEYSGESSVLALQELPFSLEAGAEHVTIFGVACLTDHPEATSEDDLKLVNELFSEFPDHTITLPVTEFITPVKNLFDTSPLLLVDDLEEKELEFFFPGERRHAEYHKGSLLSFFTGNNHVVLRAKELIVDRPHANIMQARAGFLPDENILSTTSFACGVFNSHISQGNTNFNVLLSICTSQFNLPADSGQRIFIETGDKYYLLGVPSAFEMGLNHCRWIYKHGSDCFEVRTWTSKSSPRVNMDFKVVTGKDVRILVTHRFDELNGWKIVPGKLAGEYLAKPLDGSMIKTKFPFALFRIIVNNQKEGFAAGGDELLFEDKKNHGEAVFVLDVEETNSFCMSFIGEICVPVLAEEIKNPDLQFRLDCEEGCNNMHKQLLNLSLEGKQTDIAAIQEIMPWFSMNALIHFLTPYGLEQFSGAAWGTRDISQGPFDLMLCMEKYTEARQVLRIIFSNQNPDGGWPQWWMFDSYTNIRANESHADIYYWCLIALSNYIKVTGDLSILDDVLPYYHEQGFVHSEKKALSEHVERLIKMITASFIPGTALVPFGGGDWNDSLQPVSSELARRMISSWTVEMNYQAFNQFSIVYEMIGNDQKAAELKSICDRIRDDLNTHLVSNGIVAGYGLLEGDGSISVMLHPSDKNTGIHYSLLPMNRGVISGIFTREQAENHQTVIDHHLKGPDGSRLMDRPLKYNGGIQKIFQRAESSTYFGREIGLMYMHEHIRYAESQAILGRAESFIQALRQAIPVAYRDIVPCGDLRQANCYYSSSDVAFRNRYEADDLYDEIKSGEIRLRGGWRVYSSGPGIFVSLIVTRLIGIRTEFGNTILDPVLPKSLDGFSARISYLRYPLKLTYLVKKESYCPKNIRINSKNIEYSTEPFKYREGGAIISTERFLSSLNRQDNLIEIEL